MQALRRAEEQLGAAAARGDETDAHLHQTGIQLLMRDDAAGVEHQLGAAAERLAFGRDHDGLFEVFQPEVRFLEVLDALFEHVELARLDRRRDLVEVGARAEVRSRVADDHRFEALALLDLLGCSEHQLRGRDRIGVGLCPEREERRAVSEIVQRRVAVFEDHALPVRQLQVGCRLHRLAGIEAAVALDLLLRPGGRVESLRFHQGEDLLRAEQIAELEGTLDPVVAAAHGRVDVAEIKADLVRRLHSQPHRLEHDAPQEGRFGIVSEQQAAQTLFLIAHVGERVDLRARERGILGLFVIPDETLRPLGAFLFGIEAHAGLVAEKTASDDVEQHGRTVAEGFFVIGDVRPRHVVHRVHADVQTHEVEQLEGALLGPEDQIARQRVGLREAVTAVRRGVHDRGQRHRADPVGDKARRVLAEDRRFAEAVVDERADAPNDLIVRLGVGNELDEIHIAHRVEEVNAEETALAFLRHSLRDRGDRNIRGVRTDDRPVRGVVEDELSGALLHR